MSSRSRLSAPLYSLFKFATALLLALSPAAFAQTSAPGYDVFLLVGQSNMEGTGTGIDSKADTEINARIAQWDNVHNQIVPAVDPLYLYGGKRNLIGLGLTFAKSYLATIPSNRQVLLVNAALGGTGFTQGFWIAGSGSGATTAVQYANAAMATAGSGARLAGILWHQGEADVVSSNSASYKTNLQNLIAYFRSSITGATSTTPFVVGEMVAGWETANLNDSVNGSQQYTILQDDHILPDTVPYTAWTSSELLPGDLITGNIHFSASSQRQLGRRYAQRFFQAANALPQPQLSLQSYEGAFYDDGRGLVNLSTLPINPPPTVTGTVSPLVDPLRGNVAQISQAQGFLTITVPANTFNGSYTKMAWLRPSSSGYFNQLVSASNPGQVHFLQASAMGSSLTLAAGHSSASTSANVSATVSVDPGKWVQVAVAYDAAAKTMTLYANGVQIASQSGVTAAPASTSSSATLPLYLGSLTAAGSGGVDGAMAGNRVWTTVLTSAQIASLYRFEANSTPTALVFGAVASGSSATQAYTYVPVGGAAIASVAVTTEGAMGADYTVANGSTCSAGNSYACSVAVTFTPQFIGQRRGALTITDTNGNVTTVFLSGIGNLAQPSYSSPVQSTLVSGLSTPHGVAVDGAGNVYSANYGAGTVTQTTASGATVRTITGLSQPWGVAVDGAGNLYVSEYTAQDIVKVLPNAATFNPVTVSLNGTQTPEGLTADGLGNVFAADTLNNMIWKITSMGEVQIVPTGTITLSSPSAVAVDAAGNLFIADTGNGRIVKVPLTGVANTSILISGLQKPTGVAVDGSGNLFITDSQASTLYEVAAGTTTLVTLGSGLNGATGIATSADGSLYIADAGNGRIAQVQRAILNRSSQTITFGPIANQTSGVSYPVSASASSRLPVTFLSYTTGVCTVQGNMVSVVDIGTCTVAATQAGNGFYSPAAPVSQSFTVTGTGAGTVRPVSAGTFNFNVYGIANNGTAPLNGGLDGSGYAYSANLLGSSVTWSGVAFPLGAAGTANAAAATTITLPAGNYASLKFLGTGLYGAGANATFVVTYTDGTSTTFTQSLSDWGAPAGYSGETIAAVMPYRVAPDGSTPAYKWNLYGYSFTLNPSKTVKSLALPPTRNIAVFSVALVPVQTVTALNLASVNNLYAIANDSSANSGAGQDGYSYSANLLGSSINWNNQTFVLGSAAAPSAVTSKTVPLPAGNFNSLSFLGTGIYGNQVGQVFTVTYTDGTQAKFTQSLSDWGYPSANAGESLAVSTAYRVTPTGTKQNGTWYLYGYTFALDVTKTVQSLTLPNNNHVVVLAVDLANTTGALLSQTIAFPSLASQTAGTSLSLAGVVSASSGLPVTLTSNITSICTVSGTSVSLLAAGTCSLTAMQPGNSYFAASAPVTQTFAVTAAVAPSFTLLASPASLYVAPGSSVTTQIAIVPANGFSAAVALSASGLPSGVTASFSPVSANTSTLTLTAASGTTISSVPAAVRVTGASGTLTNTTSVALTVSNVALYTPVSLSAVANRYAIANNGTANGGVAGDGYSYSANLLGSSVIWNGRSFTLGSAAAPSGVASRAIPLPAGKYTSLSFLATGVYGGQANQVFTVTYTDGTSANFTQSVSDWGYSQNYIGESVVTPSAYRVTPNGTSQYGPWNLYGYTLPVDSNKTVQSFTLPNSGLVVVLAVTLGSVPPPAPSTAAAYSTICQTGSAGSYCTDQNPGAADGNGYHNLPYWVPLNKSLATITVSDNQVWGVDSSGILWFLPNFKKGTSWTKVSSGIAQVSAGHGIVCQIDTNQHAYCASSPNPLLSAADASGFQSIAWVDTGATNYKQIAVSAGTQFWAIDLSGNLVQVKDYTHAASTSTLVAPGMQQVAVDSLGVVCAMSTSQVLSCSNWSAPATTTSGGSYHALPFVQTKASLVTFAVADGIVLGVDSTGKEWELPDYTNSSTWFPIAQGPAGTQIAGASVPSQFTASQFAANDAAVLIFMGQSNAVGFNSQPARFISPSSPNVWGVQNGGWNFLPGNTNGTTPFTAAISTINAVGFSNFALTPTSADMDLGFNSAGAPGGDAANFAAYQWQGLVNAGWGLPDLYIIHIAWPSQGVDPKDVYYGSAPWTSHGVNLWQPLLTSSQQPSYALAPFSRMILYRAMQTLLAVGKSPRILGLQWNQWEAEAGNPDPVSLTNAPTNYANLFNGFFAAVGSHYPVQLVKPLSTAYGAAPLAQMQTVFANLAATEPANLSVIDISQVSSSIFGGGVLGGGDGGVHYGLDTQQWFGKQAIGACVTLANCGPRLTQLPAYAPQ